LALDVTAAQGLFELLASYWIADTQFDSSFTSIFSHAAVSWIIAIGRPFVACALHELERQPERWSYVLAQITGGQPIPPDAEREDAVALWREWLELNDWI